MVEVQNLVKRYGDRNAVDGLSFTVEDGQVFGFLGPNGAGKSTTMNIMTGYLAPTQGRVLIDGLDIAAEPETARRRIGYLPELPPLYPDMTVAEYLRFCAELKKLPRAEQSDRIAQAVSMTHLEDQTRRLIRNLSKGFRQRVGLAQAVLHNAVVEHAPLGGKLGILLEQRHEAARKRRRAPLRRRALDLIQRDLHQPKRHLRQLVEGGHKLGQHRQIRVLPARLCGVLLLEPLFSGGEIMFHAHGGTLPSASMNVRIFFHNYSIACARAQPSLDEWGRLCYNFREERRAL